MNLHKKMQSQEIHNDKLFVIGGSTVQSKYVMMTTANTLKYVS